MTKSLMWVRRRMGSSIRKILRRLIFKESGFHIDQVFFRYIFELVQPFFEIHYPFKQYAKEKQPKSLTVVKPALLVKFRLFKLNDAWCLIIILYSPKNKYCDYGSGNGTTITE